MDMEDPAELIPDHSVTPPLKTLAFARQAQEHLDAAWAKHQKRLGSAAKGDLGAMSSRQLAEQMLSGSMSGPIDSEVDAQITASLHDSFDEIFDEWNQLEKPQASQTGNTTAVTESSRTGDPFLDIVQLSHPKVEQSIESVAKTNVSIKDAFEDLDKF